ncbi:MAG TPA: hypothetical protein VEC37_14865 [Bacillota bacterium]|nr:hypothetical protein [Bacillota bacterium]
MIEVDDAGGGCFLGPEVIVMHRLETGETWYVLIAPEIYERVRFAAKLLKKAFRELGISPSEPVRLCRGEIFDEFQQYLEYQGYQVVREKVSAETDSLAEAKFMEILYSYGFPSKLKLENRNYRELYDLVSFWYYSQPQVQKRTIRKVRLRPPHRPRLIAQQYPNLVRMMLETAL